MPQVGDPADALSSAAEAVKLSRAEDYRWLDTLACAQFANGMIEDALATALEAVDLAHAAGAPAEHLEALESHLARFEAAR